MARSTSRKSTRNESWRSSWDRATAKRKAFEQRRGDQPPRPPVERRERRAQPAEDLAEEEEEAGDAEGEKLRTDLGPWAETPSSTRVASYRYDYMNRETQVTWRNGNNPGYAYMNMNYEDFRRFARVVSKGKYINSTLDGYGYRKLTPDEVSAPTNPKRRGTVSRARS
jgi:hypothetical protein